MSNSNQRLGVSDYFIYLLYPSSITEESYEWKRRLVDLVLFFITSIIVVVLDSYRVIAYLISSNLKYGFCYQKM